MKDTVVFHLAKHFPPRSELQSYFAKEDPRTLYQQFKDGSKTSEWRDFSKYWLYKLCKPLNPNVLILFINVNGTEPQDLTPWLKVHRAWLLQGYPKANLPRLEGDISGVWYHPSSSQLETKVANVQEIIAEILERRQRLDKVNRELEGLLNVSRHRAMSMIFTLPKGSDYTRDPDQWRNEM